MKKFILFCMLCFPAYLGTQTFQNHASYVNLDNIKGNTQQISKASIEAETSQNKASRKVAVKALRMLYTIKIVISGGLLIYLVYSGVMMVISMGRTEEHISNAKRSLRYSILALFFINIPGTLFTTFYSGSTITSTGNVVSGGNLGSVGGNMSRNQFSAEVSNDSNLFYNNSKFFRVMDDLVYFIEIGIAIFAVIAIVLSGIRIITAGGDSEKVSSAKQRIIWSMAGLIFLGFMQIWKYVIYTGDFRQKGQDLFSSMVNLAIFFGGAVAIFFISMAGYYYITAAGNEDRINKAKSILLNTMLATVILLGIYVLLKDLQNLSF